MDKTLKNIYLRINATMQTLHRKAIGELLLKIIYQRINSISFEDIYLAYSKETKGAPIDKHLLESILDGLVTSNEIKSEDGRYRLSSGKRKKIDKQTSSFDESIDHVIDNYIKPVFSNDETIKDWLIDSLAFFFANYSDAWIADLKDTSSSKFNIVSSKASILDALTLRTSNNKNLDERDKGELSERFLDILTKSGDVVLSAVLFESGVSAFSSKLISTNIGVDAMTLEIFKDSVCILDTNILMYIGLEGGQYYQALEAISSAFASLGIRVYYLDATENEYLHTVGNKKESILHLINQGFDLEVLSQTDDEYIKTAIGRECINAEDFECFFEELLCMPTSLDDNGTVPISKYEPDSTLMAVMEAAKEDEKLKEELNSVFKNLTKRDKRPHALMHDVQIIAGTEEIRKTLKAFILSQDTCISEYSRKRPSVNDLTLAIKLETLINLLSVYRPEILESDIFSSLFTSMLRDGLVPRTGVFQIEDLALMSEREEQISQLPTGSIVSIAKDICRRRLSGESEESISLALSRAVQGEKMHVAVELSSTKEQLMNVTAERERETKRADNRDSLLKASLFESARKSLILDIIKKGAVCLLVTIILIYGLLIVGSYLKESLLVPPFINFIIDVVMIVVGLLVSALVCKVNKLWYLVKNKETVIHSRADEEYKSLLESE